MGSASSQPPPPTASVSILTQLQAGFSGKQRRSILVLQADYTNCMWTVWAAAAANSREHRRLPSVYLSTSIN